MNVIEVFEKPDGPIRLSPRGKWWIDRHSDTFLTVLIIADGDHVVRIAGTPEMLHNLGEAIIAHADNAQLNEGTTL